MSTETTPATQFAAVANEWKEIGTKFSTAKATLQAFKAATGATQRELMESFRDDVDEIFRRIDANRDAMIANANDIHGEMRAQAEQAHDVVKAMERAYASLNDDRSASEV